MIDDSKVFCKSNARHCLSVLAARKADVDSDRRHPGLPTASFQWQPHSQ